MAVLVFAAAIRHSREVWLQAISPAGIWIAIALNAASPVRWSDGPSRMCLSRVFDVGGWLRNLSFAAVAIAAPIAGAAGNGPADCTAGVRDDPRSAPGRVRDPVLLAIGLLLMALTALAVQSALALSFDPRYRDFPFAPLTAAVMPFLMLSFAPRPTGARAACWRKQSQVRC